MRKLGKKQLTLCSCIRDRSPRSPELSRYRMTLAAGGSSNSLYTYDTQGASAPASRRCSGTSDAGIRFNDLRTTQSSLEDIFVDLVRRGR
jgi:ABC-2 type transport system ATP-binding protein